MASSMRRDYVSMSGLTTLMKIYRLPRRLIVKARQTGMARRNSVARHPGVWTTEPRRQSEMLLLRDKTAVIEVVDLHAKIETFLAAVVVLDNGSSLSRAEYLKTAVAAAAQMQALGQSVAWIERDGSSCWRGRNSTELSPDRPETRGIIRRTERSRCGMTGAKDNVDIWSAAKAGDLASVSELCADDSSLIDARDGGGYTPLISAAESGELQVVDWLIAHGADVNARNAQRATALLQALWFHRIDCAKRLLRAGADPNLADDELRTPLLSAATMGYRSVAVDLFTPRARIATEEPKSTDGYIEIAALLIEHGANVNASNEDGATPLHQAARWGTEAHQEMCDLLLSRGADTACIDRDGVTPLEAARRAGNQKMAGFLLARGA